MTNEELLSKTISYLRFPLTVGVVFIHFNLVNEPLSIHGIIYGNNTPYWYNWIITIISDVISDIAVPLFFLISGFLFFYGKDFNTKLYKQKLKTRTRTLLIPFILWNIIAIIQILIFRLPCLSSIIPSASQIEIHLSIKRILLTFFASSYGIFVSPSTDSLAVINSTTPYPINYPLWFIRDLMVMVLLSPVMHWLIRKTNKWIIPMLGIIWCLYIPIGCAYFRMLLTAAFFFSWGAYYSINKKNFVANMRKYNYFPYFYTPIAILDTLTKGTYYNIYLHNIGIIIGIISSVVIVSNLIDIGKIKVNETLANCSFFVYALHGLILSSIGRLIFIVLHLPDITSAMLFLYFVTPLLSIVLCIIIYVSMKRFTPSICNLLTGGR